MDEFKRDISMKFTKRENGEILITTGLVDCFHDIVMTIVVDCDTMVIKDIDVNFAKAPRPDCANVKDRLSQLVGTPISRGLTKKLFHVLGGNKGCSNLRNMLLCALPIALNFQVAAGIEDHTELLDGIHEQFVGTCIGYAEPPKSIDN